MIVVITVFNRPQYLEETLQALVHSAQFIEEPVHYLTRVEPSDKRESILDIIKQHIGFDHLILNEEQIGHVNNIKYAFEDGFKLGYEIDEDYVLWLADDLILAPDALSCCVFMRDNWRDDLDVSSTALHWQKSVPESVDSYNACALRPNIHNSQAQGIWNRSWPWHLEAWEPVTTKRFRGIDPPGYEGNDQHISAAARRDGMKQAAPLLARVRTIGYEGGMHATETTLKGDNPELFAGDLDLTGIGEFRVATPEELLQPTEAWANYEKMIAGEL